MKVIGEGVHNFGASLHGREYDEARISSAASLSDLSEEYAFFNHGWLLSYGGMDVDPLQDIVNRCEETIEPAVLMSAWFDLGGDLFWARRLMIASKDVYDRYIGPQLAAVAAIDRQRRRLVRSVPQRIRIPDALILERAAVVPDPLPTVEITLFAVDATDCNVRWGEDGKKRLPINPDTVALMHALLDPK